MNHRLLILLTLLAGSLATSSHAQTVTVDGVTNNPPTTFATLSDALLSFDAGTSGANSGNAGQPNIIEITAFGPYNELIPAFGEDVVDGTEAFTIRGQGVTPLVLIQINTATAVSASDDGFVLTAGADVTVENIVFAASPTATPTDDLFRLSGPGCTLTLNDCVVTALPSNSTTFTAFGDIPADLISGDRTFDATLIRSGDNGTFVSESTAADPSVLTLNNTVWTQQGAGATPDGFVISTGARLVLNAGTKVSAINRIGVQLSSNAEISELVVTGTLANPVLFESIGLQEGGGNAGAIMPFGAGSRVEVDHAFFNANIRGLNYIFPPTNMTTPLTFTNSIFTGNLSGVRLGTAIPSVLIEDCTFIGNEFGVIDISPAGGLAEPITIRDSIFAGPSASANPAVGVSINNDTANATIENSALVLAGPNALDVGLENGSQVTQIAVITGDPEFESTTFNLNRDTPDFYLAVNASSYFAAGSGGSNLSGGGLFIGTPPTASQIWNLFE